MFAFYVDVFFNVFYNLIYIRIERGVNLKKLNEAIEKRLEEIHNPQSVEDSMKTFTIRLPIEVIEKLDDLSLPLQMKRTEVARMILTNGVEDIIEHFQMKVEKFGSSFADMYALETGETTWSELLEKWDKERKERDAQ